MNPRMAKLRAFGATPPVVAEMYIMECINFEICARSFPPEAGVFEGSQAKNKDLSARFVKMG